MAGVSAQGERANVLDSKLREPRALGTTVPRRRVLNVLAATDGEDPGVVAVSAPAGAGKTVLMVQRSRALRAEGVPVGWLSLDREDNDVSVLWTGVLAACEAAVRQIDGTVADTLRKVDPTVEGEALVRLIDAVEVLPRPVWLFLDDVHEVSSPAALSSLGRLLTVLPPRLGVMLGCRHDPPLPLPRMVVEETALEIRADQLAFDRDEAAELLRGFDVRLDDDDLDLLMTRTEGWAAGLRLAAAALAQREDHSGYVATFAGDDRPVADYLVSEVLADQPADVLTFLLVTAVPDGLTVELAGELSGRSDAGTILERLSRINALVYRLDTAPVSYRYHALLRGYLLAELDRRDASAQREIHRTASDWYVEQGVPGDALEHATKAHDWSRVTELVQRFGLSMVINGDGAVLSRMIAVAPADVVAGPAVALIAALAELQDGRLRPAGAHLDRAGRDPFVHPEPGMRLLHGAALAHEARLRGDQVPARWLIDRHDVDAEHDAGLAALVTAQRGMLQASQGALADARDDLTAASQLAGRGVAAFVDFECRAYLALTAARAGDHAEAAQQASAAMTSGIANRWRSYGAMTAAAVAAAWAAFQNCDAAGADEFVSVAAAVPGDVEPGLSFATRVLRAFVDAELTSERRSGLIRLRTTWAMGAPRHLPPPDVSSYCLTEMQMHLAMAEIGWAGETAARAERIIGPTGDIATMQTLLLTHQNRVHAARSVLEPVLSGEASCHSISAVITAWLLEAHLADANGEPSRAHEALVRAVELAAPRRAVRDVANASTQVRAMLVRGIGRFGGYDDFAGEVVAVTLQGDGLGSGGGLTARELELLRDLPSLLSLDEIADAHVVSVNTVKTHLKALYRKLEVSSRRRAVERARELGLL